MTTTQPTGRETYNPWTVVNVVFHHLAGAGLHPVLGETGDPAVQAHLADIRARMFPDLDGRRP